MGLLQPYVRHHFSVNERKVSLFILKLTAPLKLLKGIGAQSSISNYPESSHAIHHCLGANKCATSFGQFSACDMIIMHTPPHSHSHRCDPTHVCFNPHSTSSAQWLSSGSHRRIEVDGLPPRKRGGYRKDDDTNASFSSQVFPSEGRVQTSKEIWWKRSIPNLALF